MALCGKKFKNVMDYILIQLYLSHVPAKASSKVLSLLLTLVFQKLSSSFVGWAFEFLAA